MSGAESEAKSFSALYTQTDKKGLIVTGIDAINQNSISNCRGAVDMLKDGSSLQSSSVSIEPSFWAWSLDCDSSENLNEPTGSERVCVNARPLRLKGFIGLDPSPTESGPKPVKQGRSCLLESRSSICISASPALASAVLSGSSDLARWRLRRGDRAACKPGCCCVYTSRKISFAD